MPCRAVPLLYFYFLDVITHIIRQNICHANCTRPFNLGAKHCNDDDDVHKSMLELTLSQPVKKFLSDSKFNRQDMQTRWRRTFLAHVWVCAHCGYEGVLTSYHHRTQVQKVMRWKSLKQSHLLNYSNWPRAHSAHGHVQRASWAIERTTLNCIQSHCFGQWVNM